MKSCKGCDFEVTKIKGEKGCQMEKTVKGCQRKRTGLQALIRAKKADEASLFPTRAKTHLNAGCFHV